MLTLLLLLTTALAGTRHTTWMAALASERGFQWDDHSLCNTTAQGLSLPVFSRLKEQDQNQVLYCFLSLSYDWNMTVAVPDRQQGWCRDIFSEVAAHSQWSTVTPLTLYLVADCLHFMFNELVVNRWDWYINGGLPQTHIRSISAYMQYVSDMAAPVDALLSPLYQKRWHTLFGLDTRPYSPLKTPCDVALFRSKARLYDYFQRNNATHCTETVALVKLGLAVAGTTKPHLNSLLRYV